MSAIGEWLVDERFVLRPRPLGFYREKRLLKPGSYFEKELEYVASKGYQLSADQSRLVKGNP